MLFSGKEAATCIVTSPVLPPSGDGEFRHPGDEEERHGVSSSFSVLENISPESPSKHKNNTFPSLGQLAEVSSPTFDTDRVNDLDPDKGSLSLEFDSSSNHGDDCDQTGSDPNFDQSPFDVIQSYCELEREWDGDNEQKNPPNLDVLYSKLTQNQYSDEDLIVYYDDSLPTGQELLAKCNLDAMCDSLTESAISQGSPYHIPRPEHPTVRYLKEESRREVLGRLSSSEDDKFNFDEEILDLSDVCCEKFSSNSSNDEQFL